MGQLSPAAHDALLLEKVKLLLQAAMQNPRRRGPATTYEAFVEGLDIRDESSLRAFELLLYVGHPRFVTVLNNTRSHPMQQETTTRRPHKVRRIDPVPAASTSQDASSVAQPARRRRAFSSSGERSGLVPIRNVRNRYAIFEDTDSDTGSEEEIRPQRRVRELAGGRTSDRVAGEVGLPTHAAADTTATAISRSANEAGVDPTSLASGSLSEYVLYELLVHASGRALGDGVPFEVLWRLVLDQPLPPGVTSFPSFIHELNASGYSDTPIAATDIFDLLRQLIQRDPDVLNRAANASRAVSRGTRHSDRSEPPRQRQAIGVYPWTLASRQGGASVSDVPGTDDSPLREGIWHTSFVEHLDDGTSRDIEVDLDSFPGTGEAFSFGDFAQQRRAARRANEGDQTDTATSILRRGSIDRRLANIRVHGFSSDGTGSVSMGTPAITMTSASTPATSAAHSPPESSSVPTAECPVVAPQRSSAAIAEAHFRLQRRVVALRAPSPTGDLSGGSTSALRTEDDAGEDGSVGNGTDATRGTNQSMRTVVEALQRARSRRTRSGAPEAATDADPAVQSLDLDWNPNLEPDDELWYPIRWTR